MKTPEQRGLKDVVLRVRKTDEMMKGGFELTFLARDTGLHEPLRLIVHKVELAKLARRLEELIGSTERETRIEGVYVEYGQH